jgi:hypothetical protein
MIDKEILQKAIERAEKNGFKHELIEHYNKHDFTKGQMCAAIILNKEHYSIIFRHDFAKAFWGEKKRNNIFTDEVAFYLWQGHLQQMVLEKEPLKYIEKFL